MSKSNLWTATFLRSGKTFRTEEPVNGPLGPRRAILDNTCSTHTPTHPCPPRPACV